MLAFVIICHVMTHGEDCRSSQGGLQPLLRSRHLVCLDPSGTVRLKSCGGCITFLTSGEMLLLTTKEFVCREKIRFEFSHLDDPASIAAYAFLPLKVILSTANKGSTA